MKLTSQILSLTCLTPTFWPANTVLSPDYARDLNSSEMWAQTKGRSSLI